MVDVAGLLKVGDDWLAGHQQREGQARHHIYYIAYRCKISKHFLADLAAALGNSLHLDALLPVLHIPFLVAGPSL